MTRFPLLAALPALLSVALPAQGETEPQPAATQPAGVEIVQAPSGARQPAFAVDPQGELHVVYLRPEGGGEQKRSNIYYSVWDRENERWSEPLEASSRKMAAMRPQIAVGQNGRVHVVWGSPAPRGFWYTYMDPKIGKFVEETDVLPSNARGLELGPVVAADQKGSVFLAWHQGPFTKEDERGVFMVRSRNGGKSFSPARQISPSAAGACGCCDMAMTIDDDGKVYVAFRAAIKTVGRDMMLLTSSNGSSFKAETIDEWQYERCPTATASVFANHKGDVVLAWETESKLYWGRASDLQSKIPVGEGEAQRYPSVAENDRGETLVAWFSGKGARNPGSVMWRVFDAEGKPTERQGRFPANPGSALGVGVRPDGTFVLAY